jgi:hypothetical protein
MKRHILRVRTVVLAVVAATATLCVVAPAQAGYYDYIISAPGGGDTVTRGALHDYSYLHTWRSGLTVCVQRSLNGQKFCAGGTSSHTYDGSCNPDNCASFYGYNGNYGYEDLNVHEQWR